MKYALIGCGRIANNHIKAALATGLEIVALCDVISERAEIYATKNKPDCKIYTDYKAMLTEIEPEFSAIATESGKHAEIAIDCINAGTNVLIEKPIALCARDADEIISAARLNGVSVGVCHQNRFNKAVQKLRTAVDEGRFGRIYNIAAVVRWNRNEDYYKQAPWRGTWAQDGGCLMNQCIHNIDLLRWIGGDVESVTGVTNNFQHPYIEAEDFGTAIVKFKSGAVGTVEGTVNVYPRNMEETLTVFGERGTVKLGGKSLNTIELWEFEDSKDSLEDVQREFTESPPDIYGFGHTPLYRDFIEAINDNRRPYISAEDGKRAMLFVLAIYQSSARGHFVKFPLETCSTIDFKGMPDRIYEAL